MRLINFFKSPSSWSQKDAALDKYGDPYNLSEYKQEDFKDGNRLESFSLSGAIAYFFSFEKEPETRNKTIQKIRKAIVQHTGKNYNISEFNDSPLTKFEDIQKVVKLAENR